MDHEVPGAGSPGPGVRGLGPPVPDVRIHASRKGAEKSGEERHSKARHDGASELSPSRPSDPGPTTQDSPDRTRRHGAAPRTPGAWSCGDFTARRAASLTHVHAGNHTTPHRPNRTPWSPDPSPWLAAALIYWASRASMAGARGREPSRAVSCMRGGPGCRWTVVAGMSCNGCRVLRKGCSEDCVLRPCLQWIEGAEAQGHATVFVAKFFGRAGLMSFLTAVPEPQRPAVFQSLLYEAAGRTINPVSGAVGLLGSGSWHLCQAAVETVLRGGSIRPLPELDGGFPAADAGAGSRDPFAFTARRAVGCLTFSTAKRAGTRNAGEPDASAAAHEPSCDLGLQLSPESPPAPGERRPRRPGTPSMNSQESVTTTTTTTTSGERGPELLNLFV